MADAPSPTPSAEQSALMRELEALVPLLRTVDPAKPREAERALTATVPLASLRASRIRALAKVGMEQGWLVTKAAGPRVKFGRLAKDLGGYSVDAVWMEGPAAGHTHVNGEINLGFAWTGHPTFDGHPPGWVVFPPMSHHVPTVLGGEMLLFYFLPGGKVAWDPAPPK
jgi:hypothetical protein